MFHSIVNALTVLGIFFTSSAGDLDPDPGDIRTPSTPVVMAYLVPDLENSRKGFTSRTYSGLEECGGRSMIGAAWHQQVWTQSVADNKENLIYFGWKVLTIQTQT